MGIVESLLEGTAYQEAIDEALKKVVTVKVNNGNGYTYGSGFVIEEEVEGIKYRYIVTTSHVTAQFFGPVPSSCIEIITSSGKTIPMTFADYSWFGYDLAVLGFWKEEDLPSEFPEPFEWSKSVPKPGRKIFALGNPFYDFPFSYSLPIPEGNEISSKDVSDSQTVLQNNGLSNCWLNLKLGELGLQVMCTKQLKNIVTDGIISTVSDEDDSNTGPEIIHTATLLPGNSGGPLLVVEFDECGPVARVIGVNYATFLSAIVDPFELNIMGLLSRNLGLASNLFGLPSLFGGFDWSISGLFLSIPSSSAETDIRNLLDIWISMGAPFKGFPSPVSKIFGFSQQERKILDVKEKYAFVLGDQIIIGFKDFQGKIITFNSKENIRAFYNALKTNSNNLFKDKKGIDVVTNNQNTIPFMTYEPRKIEGKSIPMGLKFSQNSAHRKLLSGDLKITHINYVPVDERPLQEQLKPHLSKSKIILHIGKNGYGFPRIFPCGVF